jgi:hypothetical protein
LDHYPPIILPEYLGWLAHATMPSFYWLRWDLVNFLPGLSSQSKITGMSHWAQLNLSFKKLLKSFVITLAKNTKIFSLYILIL